MTLDRPDDPIEWVEARLETLGADVAEIRPTHEPNAIIKADIRGLRLQVEALTDIVRMLAIETAALRHQAPD